MGRLVTLKCNVAGGHSLDVLDRHLTYEETVELARSKIEECEEIQDAIREGKLVVDGHRTFREEAPRESKSEETETDRLEETETDRLEELFERQLQLLERIESKLDGFEIEPEVNVTVEGTPGHQRGASKQGEREEEYVPTQIRSDNTDTSGLKEAETSKKESADKLDAASKALDSLNKEDSDER